ncbi:hypothetical protein [Sulfitobacter sp.]|uniref:hypothetical protein n=1 Tax=Sulfitobacter sp. TaxID=1903071 RepID=UPI0030017F42
MPDERWGEVGCACVIAKPGHTSNGWPNTKYPNQSDSCRIFRARPQERCASTFYAMPLVKQFWAAIKK